MNDYDPYSPQNYDPAMEDDGFSASYNLPPAQDEGGNLSVRGDMAGWLEKSRNSIAAIYDQAARDLQARYRGPSDKELLLAMGAAMLKPTEGGFSEALGNAISVVPEFMKQKRSYQEELGQLMARGQYDKARALASLEGRALTAMRPRAPNELATVDTLGNIRHKVTKAVIKQPPQNEIYALQTYLSDPGNTDADKETTRRNFDSAYGFGAHEIFGGQ
jgi:hypothetical protein